MTDIQPSTTPMIRLGTRGSRLALLQAEEVRRRLTAANPELAVEGAVEVVVIRTTGDRVTDRALAEIGGKGLFTKEIEEALADGRIDAAVHSMKDVPTWIPDGMALAAILPREDVRDAYFSPHGPTLLDLPAGAVVGSASLRRQAQVLAARPDVQVSILRGNVETRLRKLAAGEVDATLLAVAGLNRLGLAERIESRLDPQDMLPAVAQGAIGLEIRADDARTRDLVAPLDHQESALCVLAERACLEVLDGSCRTPIGVLAELEDGGDSLRLRALLAEPDGSRLWRSERRGAPRDAVELARDAGRELRAAAGEDFFERLADLF
ncbi:MAG: hydroxymethylbilane synthase [Rhodovibrionaceae bacterium]|nr:hydroxymethylbilane synthase [Rhodovibrionaceae bacterium]